MYNLAIRKCTSAHLLAPRLKIFKLKFTTPSGIDLLSQRDEQMINVERKKCSISHKGISLLEDINCSENTKFNEHNAVKHIVLRRWSRKFPVLCYNIHYVTFAHLLYLLLLFIRPCTGATPTCLEWKVCDWLSGLFLVLFVKETGKHYNFLTIQQNCSAYCQIVKQQEDPLRSL